MYNFPAARAQTKLLFDYLTSWNNDILVINQEQFKNNWDRKSLKS